MRPQSGLIRIRHSLSPQQAQMVRDEMHALWPGYDIEIKFARQRWRPWRRGLGIKVVHP